MLTRTGADLRIDAAHARAICDEIGERLRDMLWRQLGTELPPRLRDLMAQLEKLDDATSPSIVPSLDDIAIREIAIRQEPNAPGRETVAVSMLESA
jgi:hypothetical protein